MTVMLVLAALLFAIQMDLTRAVVAAGTVNTVFATAETKGSSNRLYAFPIIFQETKFALGPCPP